MIELPDDFDADPIDPEDMTENATPAVGFTSSEGDLFLVVGTIRDRYVGCLVRPNGVVEGYYRIPDTEGGLTEALEPFRSTDWERR